MNLNAAVEAIETHCALHPAMQPQDLLKAVHQSVFGCGHLVRSADDAQSFLTQEARQAPMRSGPWIELLGDAFCRVDLDILRAQGLSPATLTRLFYLSADSPCGSAQEADALLTTLSERPLPFPAQSFARASDVWRAAGFPALRHTPEYRAAYAPAYRVIRSAYARALPLFAAIDRALSTGRTWTVALDGPAGSGKTTLSGLLAAVYDCNVFHMDDFFLRPEQRSAQRLSTPGENVDHERFLAEILLPLHRGEAPRYRRFDCSTCTLCPPVSVQPRPLNIIEGSYSLHPSLRPYYDFCVYLSISPAEQAARIRARNTPELADLFFTRWIPLEEQYFRAFAIARSCDLILPA